uniref:MHC class II beta chain n=1 Tax=Romanomermis culicivorax TaxID=13658 RepID=A0A915L231_ROMCU
MQFFFSIDSSSRFCVGDKFYLDTDNNKILCEYDYNERLYFAQFSQYGYNSLAHLKRQISQVDDFEESRCKPFPMEKRTIYYQQ